MIKLMFDPVAELLKAAQGVYPTLEADVWLAPDLEHPGETLFPDGDKGDRPVVRINPKIPYIAVVEVLAHELAHVVVGPGVPEAEEHGKAWDVAFQTIYNRYQTDVAESAQQAGRPTEMLQCPSSTPMAGEKLVPQSVVAAVEGVWPEILKAFDAAWSKLGPSERGRVILSENLLALSVGCPICGGRLAFGVVAGSIESAGSSDLMRPLAPMVGMEACSPVESTVLGRVTCQSPACLVVEARMALTPAGAPGEQPPAKEG